MFNETRSNHLLTSNTLNLDFSEIIVVYGEEIIVIWWPRSTGGPDRPGLT